MSQDQILKCLIAFVLGFLVARMFRGNGLSVGGATEDDVNCLDKVPIPPGCIASRCTKWNEGRFCKNAVPTRNIAVKTTPSFCFRIRSCENDGWLC